MTTCLLFSGWAEPECIDEDKDGYGKAGTYTFTCPKKGEDCWDNPAMNWDFSGVWVIPENFNSNQRKTVAKIYQKTMDLDRDGDIADEVNPGVDEKPGLYGASWHNIIPQDQWTWWELPRIWVSACTDGIDNDCDSFYDCFDAGCAISAYIEFRDTKTILCQGSCGEACVKKYPAMIGARCADNLLAVPNKGRFKGKNTSKNSFK